MRVVPSGLDFGIIASVARLGPLPRFLDTTGGLTRDILRAIRSQDALLSSHRRSPQFSKRLVLRFTFFVSGPRYTEHLWGRLLPIMVGVRLGANEAKPDMASPDSEQMKGDHHSPALIYPRLESSGDHPKSGPHR